LYSHIKRNITAIITAAVASAALAVLLLGTTAAEVTQCDSETLKYN
jgi:hypothetical protein